MTRKKTSLLKSILLLFSVGIVAMVFKEKIMPHLSKVPFLGEAIQKAENSQISNPQTEQ